VSSFSEIWSSLELIELCGFLSVGLYPYSERKMSLAMFWISIGHCWIELTPADWRAPAQALIDTSILLQWKSVSGRGCVLLAGPVGCDRGGWEGVATPQLQFLVGVFCGETRVSPQARMGGGFACCVMSAYLLFCGLFVMNGSPSIAMLSSCSLLARGKITDYGG
jgi:hypothetical protein